MGMVFVLTPRTTIVHCVLRRWEANNEFMNLYSVPPQHSIIYKGATVFPSHERDEAFIASDSSTSVKKSRGSIGAAQKLARSREKSRPSSARKMLDGLPWARTLQCYKQFGNDVLQPPAITTSKKRIHFHLFYARVITMCGESMDFP